VTVANPPGGPSPDAGWGEGLVKLETRDRVAIAWLDHPPANALSPAMVDALRQAWGEISESAVRAFVIASANPRLFCAGADIKAFTAMDDAAGRAYVAGTHELLRAFEHSSIVTLAAVNGLALGGGCELAMACDLRIAAASARFGQPEVKLGIIPGFGGTQRLARLVGPAKALELNLLGDPIRAQDAEALGLANRVVPDEELLETALGLAETLAARAPIAVDQIKRVSAHADLEQGLADEQAAFAEAFASADAREGIAAFLEKRSPEFRGR
jgi:enoyl-CoA hydratase/3-hydroxyacyl-CoA dehydrogenase